ncbi:uncharacterized protein LOC143040582 isoform X2 [Oratosquilla oratoria]|uniref:uncharacterized protein LOC143040582 isoform X2 n=1 Tax=Oratosquilla oratoria TaxID=337810 RepID=UPI003F75E058
MNRSAALQDACFERILQKIDSNKYYCVMCKMHFTGESPTISHLLTTKHSESLAKEAVGIYTGATISQIRLDVLLKKIPDEITIGITKRVITLKNGLFWCDSCQKSFTGTQPVLEHLSSKHSTMTAPIEIGQQIADATPENYSTMVDTDLTSSIYKGQIVQDEENYNCIICRKFLAGKEQAKQHIAGKSHQKKLKNRLDQPVQKAPGARDLPPQPVVVTPPSNKADAKFQQQVADSTPENYSTMEDIELTRSMNARQVVQDGEMYNCIVCTKSLTGKEPAKQHIAGKSHQKKLKSRLDQSIQNVPDGRDLTPQLAVATPLSDQVDNIQQQVADSTPENYSTMEDIELTRSMNARQVVQDGEMYNCIVCTKSLTGKEPAKQHIAGKSHQKKLKSRLDQSIQNVPDGRDLTPQLAVATPLSDQVDNIAAQHTATPLRNPIGYRPCRPPERVLRPMIRQPHLTSRTNEPFREEHKQTSGHPVQQQYDQTDILETQIGQRERKHKDAPKMEQREELKEELEGESVVLRRHHKAFDNDSKTLERGNFPLHAYPTMQRQYALRWKRPISLHQKVEERQESGANNLLKKNQSSSTIKGSPEYDKPPLISKFLKVRASVNLVGPTDQVYRNLSNPRGLVFIFNYKKYASGRLSERRGSGHDVKNLRCLFVQMGYSVHAYEDLTGWGTLAQIREIQGRQDLWAVDSFIIILLGQGANAGTFYASDMRRIPLDDVRLEFSEGRCPALKGKPKIVLANFFHGNVEEILSAPSTSPNDMLTLHASIAGIRPRRHPLESTIFVQILSEVLSTESWATPLEELCFQVCWRVQSCGGTACLERNKDFKEFYFNP